jgi:hypothetical protein
MEQYLQMGTFDSQLPVVLEGGRHVRGTLTPPGPLYHGCSEDTRQTHLKANGRTVGEASTWRKNNVIQRFGKIYVFIIK